jgi:hypothetical protein
MEGNASNGERAAQPGSQFKVCQEKMMDAGYSHVDIDHTCFSGTGRRSRRCGDWRSSRLILHQERKPPLGSSGRRGCWIAKCRLARSGAGRKGQRKAATANRGGEDGKP